MLVTVMVRIDDQEASGGECRDVQELPRPGETLRVEREGLSKMPTFEGTLRVDSVEETGIIHTHPIL